MNNVIEFFGRGVGATRRAAANDRCCIGQQLGMMVNQTDEGRASMGTGLFDRTGVRYEVAVDVLGALISHHAEGIAIEEEKDQPDRGLIEAAEGLQRELRDIRDDLDADDATAIEAVIAKYAPQARAAFNK